MDNSALVGRHRLQRDGPTRLAHLLRDAEGHLSEVVKVPDLMIQEYHSPILDLVDAFPLVRRLEKEMFETLLGASVERHEERASGLYLCTFLIN